VIFSIFTCFLPYRIFTNVSTLLTAVLVTQLDDNNTTVILLFTAGRFGKENMGQNHYSFKDNPQSDKDQQRKIS
jgi:hypothetical protein